MKKLTTIAISLLCLSSCLSDEPLKLHYEGYAPAILSDGWEVSTPEVENMNPLLLDEAFRQVYWQDGFLGARSLLVFRNGKLVAEAYPNDLTHIDEINNVQSITKSFTSILVGIAIDKGDLDSPETPLYEIYPEHFYQQDSKRTITIEHALTMTTGLKFDNESDFIDFYQYSGNAADYVIKQPLINTPGSTFNYSDGSPQLIVEAIEKSTQSSFEDYAVEKLLDPMGVTNFIWEKGNDGTNFGAFGLFLTPRDLGKFGQLMLDKGEWGGQQLVSNFWIEKATNVRRNLVGGGGQYFGYYFWLNPSNGSYASRGNGGQFVYIVPEKNMVIVYTASPSISEYLNYEHNLVNSIINSSY